jgi:hypothetical protein
MSIVEHAKEIAISIIVLIAIVLPFSALFVAQNATLVAWGLPLAGVTGLALLIVVFVVFRLLKK